MSFGWWRDLYAIADEKINTGLHVDISGWQADVKHHPDEFARAVRRFIDALGSDRILFGTDDPAFDPVHPKEEWIDNVRGLAARTEGPTFTDDEIDALLGGAAQQLFDIE